jgi:hypothetical protein
MAYDSSKPAVSSALSSSEIRENFRALKEDRITAKRAGDTVQMVSTSISSVVSCTTVMPFDDTIPQNTEGNEVLTLSITPTSATNKLVIEANITGACSNYDTSIIALFQDSAADALAVVSGCSSASTKCAHSILTYVMVAGTTSSTTFKIRLGLTTYIAYINANYLGSRVYGGKSMSTLKITEIQV